MSEALQNKLVQAEEIFRKGEGSKEPMYELAAEKYEPAKQLFVEMLDSSDWRWRDAGLAALAQYSKPDSALMDRIRRLLAEDDEENVRVAAAAQLGADNQWPDEALRHALENDSSRRVRVAAFESALTLMGMPWPDVQSESERVESGEIEPTLSTAEDIIERWRKEPKKPG